MNVLEKFYGKDLENSVLDFIYFDTSIQLKTTKRKNTKLDLVIIYELM